MAEPSPFFIVRIHASYPAVGYAVVRIVDGEEQIVNSGCKRLSKAQSNQSNFEREFAALRFALNSNATLLGESDYIVESNFRRLRSLLSLRN